MSSHVPAGWNHQRLAELTVECSVRNDGSLTSSDVYGVFKDVGLIPMRDRVMADKVDRYKVVQLDQFAYNPMRLNIGSIARSSASGAVLVSPDYEVFRCREGVCDPEWLDHLRGGPTWKSFVERAGSGSVRVRIYYTDLATLEVPVPPLGEQRKIAAILASIDDAIEATQAVLDQLAVVKQAMMADLLTRGIPGRHTRFKQTEIGEVPEEWKVKLCGDVFDVQLGKMMSVDARAGANQLPYLRNENVYWHSLDLSDVATMHFDERERAKFRLRRGDLLACEGRHIGRCAIWREELDECYFQKALHRLRAKSDEVTTDYMQHFMMLRFNIMGDLVAEANSTSTIPHLPREKLLALPMWFPPRTEQDEIVASLEAMTERVRSEQQSLAALTATKSALAAALLSGEVRVTPDAEAP